MKNQSNSVVVIVESCEWKDWKKELKKGKDVSFNFKIFSSAEKREMVAKKLFKVDDFKNIKIEVLPNNNGGQIIDKDVLEKLISFQCDEKPEEIGIHQKWEWDDLGKYAPNHFAKVKLTQLYNNFSH